MTRNRKFIILLIFMIGVTSTFWLVSRYPALDTKAALSGSEAFEDPLTHQAHFTLRAKQVLSRRWLIPP